MPDVVLVNPEIATNTGNIIRLCANAGVRLHLVEPLGFTMDDPSLRRAGLDYHDLASVTVHADLDTALGPFRSRRRFALSSHGSCRLDHADIGPNDVVVFGAERCGLSADSIERIRPTDTVRIPMRSGNRSMNLANAVAVVVYETWRRSGFAGAADSGTTTSETLTSDVFDR